MSYARFGSDSDVYVFLNVSGYFECCGCELLTDTMSATFKTTDEMVTHLREHIAAEHAVPDFTIPALETERKENDSWIENYDGEDE